MSASYLFLFCSFSYWGNLWVYYIHIYLNNIPMATGSTLSPLMKIVCDLQSKFRPKIYYNWKVLLWNYMRNRKMKERNNQLLVCFQNFNLLQIFQLFYLQGLSGYVNLIEIVIKIIQKDPYGWLAYTLCLESKVKWSKYSVCSKALRKDKRLVIFLSTTPN